MRKKNAPPSKQRPFIYVVIHDAKLGAHLGPQRASVITSSLEEALKAVSIYSADYGPCEYGVWSYGADGAPRLLTCSADYLPF